jgi:rubrerythrin
MAAKLTGKETLEEIVHRAVDAEAKSILFYVGIKDLVEEPAAREKVAALIEEERKHIITLQNMLAASRQK